MADGGEVCGCVSKEGQLWGGRSGEIDVFWARLDSCLVDVNDKFVVMNVLTVTLSFNINTLVKIQSSCYLFCILLHDLLPELFTHHIVAINQIKPPPPPYKKPRAKGHRSVYELRLLIEGQVISTD